MKSLADAAVLNDVLSPRSARNVSFTLQVSYSGTDRRRSHVSTCHILADGRYRMEQPASTEIFDGATHWTIPKGYGPVLRAGHRTTLAQQMIDPGQLFASNEYTSSRRIIHGGRDALALDLLSAYPTTIQQNEQSLIIDVEWGVVMAWQNLYTGREVKLSDVRWNPWVDNAAFRFDAEERHTIVDLKFI